MVTVWLWLMAAAIVGQRVTELVIARRNRNYLSSVGAREFGAGHYPLFLILHTGWLVGWVSEGLLHGATLHHLWCIWGLLFVAAQVLRYWCILSLGPCWNTRILVVPGAGRVRRGPYRYIPHPNYLAVCIELFCVPLLFNAWLTALTAIALNAVLLRAIRIPAEERALKLLR